MGIDVQIALCLDLQVDEAVARQLFQHMIQKADAGIDGILAAAVEIEGDADLGFLGAAFDGDDTSFTETMTGIVANIGEKFSNRKEKQLEEPAPTPAPAASTDSPDGSPFCPS